MKVDLGDLNAFVAVARAKGFRGGARSSGASASRLSEAVRRLEADLGVRGQRRARDLWRQMDLGNVSGNYAADVPHHGVVFVRLFPR